jgi:N utilization substance protein B
MATRTQARESVIGLLYAYGLGNEGITKFVDEILEDKKIRNKQKDFALKSR